jgi:molecular chaperone HscB
VNTAYRTLSSPLLRAQYILSQHGHTASETDTLTDEELIMNIMEAREELDSATSLQEMDDIRTKNDGE